MKKDSRKDRPPDKNLHIPKRVAGGATGLALGAMVGGPVGAIIGGMAGAMVGSATEARSSAVDRPVLMKKSAQKIRYARGSARDKGKAEDGRKKSAVGKHKRSLRSVRRGSKTSTKKG